jgi:hypothetical protein
MAGDDKTASDRDGDGIDGVLSAKEKIGFREHKDNAISGRRLARARAGAETKS